MMSYPVAILFTSVVFATGLSLGFIISNDTEDNIITIQETEWMTNKCINNKGIRRANIQYMASCNDGALFSDDYDVDITRGTYERQNN